MAETKKCIACLQEKPIEDFWKDKYAKGGRVPRCMQCQKEGRQKAGGLKIEKLKPGKEPEIRIPNEIIEKDLDLDFLADIRRTGKTGWQLPQVKLLISKVDEAWKAGVTNFDKIFQAFGSGRSKSGCVSLLAELKKLALSNRERKETGKTIETLEEYWKIRRFKVGNEVVAEKINGKQRKK